MRLQRDLFALGQLFVVEDDGVHSSRLEFEVDLAFSSRVAEWRRLEAKIAPQPAPCAGSLVALAASVANFGAAGEARVRRAAAAAAPDGDQPDVDAVVAAVRPLLLVGQPFVGHVRAARLVLDAHLRHRLQHALVDPVQLHRQLPRAVLGVLFAQRIDLREYALQLVLRNRPNWAALAIRTYLLVVVVFSHSYTG